MREKTALKVTPRVGGGVRLILSPRISSFPSLFPGFPVAIEICLIYGLVCGSIGRVFRQDRLGTSFHSWASDFRLAFSNSEARWPKHGDSWTKPSTNSRLGP